MTNKILIHSLVHTPTEVSQADVYTKPFNSINITRLDRDGLFFSVFNKMFDPHYALTPHVLTSEFEVFNSHEFFYRISSKNQIALNSADEILLLLHLNPVDCSLELLSDFLNCLKKNNHGKARIVAHYHYDVDLRNNVDQIYVTSYFKTIQQILGDIPETCSTLEIEKKATFQKTVVVEAGSQWKCLDNYLVHVILSKGGSYYQLTNPKFEYDIMSEEALSPFHSLQLIKRKPGFTGTCIHNEELKKKNFLNHPEEIKVFYYLIYKNIFK
jgi:hypothetical protein